MNKKVKYRVWKYWKGQKEEYKVIFGMAEMLSQKRYWKRIGFQVKIEKYIPDIGWKEK